ncbi:phospholipase C [Caballeronia hypogeia]|uniref:Phospholipase C n=1 Tax=Caballeronia hypogeia TaxID=1777140 RepID=A0A158CDN0_9BURK|nr:phospholipase C [Caballeronia hypogeia]
MPYELFVRTRADGPKDTVSFDFVNTGSASAVFLLYRHASADAPRTYTGEARKRLADRIPVNADGSFDFVVHGPNGFLRRIAGKAGVPHGGWSREQAAPEVAEGYDVANGNLQLRLENRGTASCTFTMTNAHDASKSIARHGAVAMRHRSISTCAMRTARTTPK